MDPIQFGKELGVLVREQVAKSVASMVERLAAVEQQLASLRTPNDGTSVTVEDMRPLVAELVGEAVKSIPPATPGADGKSVTAEDVLPALQDQLREAIAAIPVPQDGKSVSLADLQGAVQPVLLERIEQMQAKWELDFERRAQDNLQRALDRIPTPKNGKPGKDGLDGMGFEDLTVEHDGERAFTIKLQRGERVKEFTFSIPVVIDRGFWKEGTTVKPGDGVTFGGSYWIAQKDTDTKPDIGNPDWRLAVKKGRDAK